MISAARELDTVDRFVLSVEATENWTMEIVVTSQQAGQANTLCNHNQLTWGPPVVEKKGMNLRT